MRVLKRRLTLDGHQRRKCTVRYDTFAPLVFASVSPLTSRFPLTMVAGGFCPYHRMWTDDAPSKRKVVTPTLGGMMHALGFVSCRRGRELLVTPPPRRICQFCFLGRLWRRDIHFNSNNSMFF